jgi:cyclase
MLKKRIVASLVIKNGIVVQSIRFNQYLPVGTPLVAVEFLNLWGIDEIVLLDIDATVQGRKPDFELIRSVSKKCFVPLTVGGGIRTLEDMRNAIHFGADKISINAMALEEPTLIAHAAKVFGSQSIVVSIDAQITTQNTYTVYSYSRKAPTGLSAVEWARKVEKLGAGEIFLNSVDRDGSKAGYDLALVKMVSNVVSIPVIACGGVGNPQHFLEALLNSKASAAAAGNFFHFTEHSPIVAKAYLRVHDIDIRFDSYAQYNDFAFNADGRLAKREEEYLEKLRFQYHPEEVI